jgi:hypothetical protein
MSTALTTRPDTGFLVIDTFEQAIKVAEYVNKSALVPEAYRGKPADIVIAMQYGMELGLSPMQSLQSVAVINGRPSIYGDALPAIVMLSPDFEDIELQEPEGADPDHWVAVCTVRRHGRAPVVRRFSTADAKIAKLWGKAGPWTTNPKRMLMMRARGFGVRDAYPDRMKGLITAEEAIDITPIAATPPSEPRRISEANSTPSVDDTVWKASAQPVAPAAPPPPTAGSADQVWPGVKVLRTQWVDDGAGGFFWEITTTRGVLMTRDKGLGEEASTCADSDALLKVHYRFGKRMVRGKEERVHLLMKLELDETPEQPTLPTEGE